MKDIFETYISLCPIPCNYLLIAYFILNNVGLVKTETFLGSNVIIQDCWGNNYKNHTQGNVSTPVCHSVRGGCLADTTPPGLTPPPTGEDTLRDGHCSRRYLSTHNENKLQDI